MILFFLYISSSTIIFSEKNHAFYNIFVKHAKQTNTRYFYNILFLYIKIFIHFCIFTIFEFYKRHAKKYDILFMTKKITKIT